MNKGTCLLSTLIIILFLSACQRELSFEKQLVSQGSLKKDMAGNCDTIIHQGTYSENRNLNDSNSLNVTAIITKAGTYTISSDTVNGYSFSASGTFNSTGNLQVKLKGSGRPLLPGTDLFQIHYGASICEAAITVNKDLSTPASFTLAGAPANCMNPVVSGNFIKGYATDTASQVEITLLVTAPGTYSISTGLVNGYRFSGAGTVNSTGKQTIILKASGSPSNAGTDLFTVTAGTSACTFPVTVLSPVTAADLDHFPLTQGSFWVYDYITYNNDSLVRTVTGASVKNGNSYAVVKQVFTSRPNADRYYRKFSNAFFEFASFDQYTATVSYMSGAEGEIPILKEGLATGEQWSSPEYTGTASFGQVINLQYIYYCLDANGAAVINGRAFINVYKIRMNVLIRSLNAGFGSTGEVYEFYFAKGIGLIYVVESRQNMISLEQKIRRWQVN